MKVIKKKYIAPDVEQIFIDNEISLIMMSTTEDTGPDDPFGGTAATTETSTTTESATTYENPLESNPFE